MRSLGRDVSTIDMQGRDVSTDGSSCSDNDNCMDSSVLNRSSHPRRDRYEVSIYSTPGFIRFHSVRTFPNKCSDLRLPHTVKSLPVNQAIECAPLCTQAGISQPGKPLSLLQDQPVLDLIMKPPTDHVLSVLAEMDDWKFDSFKLNEVTNGRPLSTVAFAILRKCDLFHGRWEFAC